jgi:hypothetical protein
LPVVLLALLAAVTTVCADEPPADEIFRDNTEQLLGGAATLAGAGCQGGHGTPMILGMLLQGERLHLWKIEESNKALPLSPGLLEHVEDSAPLRDDKEGYEPKVYCEALLKSSLTSLGAFANSANRSASYADLFNEPVQWRGQVIHYEGTVRRIHHMRAPVNLQAKGIEDLYECWLFGVGDGYSHPVCLVCTELPPGVTPGDKLNIQASFDAYFFKRYRYKAVDSKPNQAREAPLFIGRSFVLRKSQAETFVANAAGHWATILMIFLGAAVATFVLAFGLHWWFRRNDRRIQARVRAARRRYAVDAGEVIVPDTSITTSPDVARSGDHATTALPDNSITTRSASDG